MKEHFERFLGSGNATDAEADLLAYSYDGSELSGKARLVVFPSQEEQLRLILTYANRSNIDVILRGNGSNNTGMTVPNNSIVVCTQGFDRIHALNVGQKWVKVDCGVTLADLNEALGKEGFRYALDTPMRKLTTIGSLLARNAASRYSQLYGRVADTVLELDVMDGTGKFFTVTKDFDEYLGNEGSIFVLIRAKLKIIPFTPRSADMTYFDTMPQALEYCNTIKEKKPLAIELLDGAVAAYCGINTKPTVIVEWEGLQGQIQYEKYAALINKREHVRRALGLKGYIHIDDGTLTPEKLGEAIDWAQQHELPVIAHAGLGIVHPFFKREQQALRDEWSEWLQKEGQLVTGQFGYGLRKKKYVNTGLKNKIRKLKERYDYNNVLARGKLYDYI
jgi:FAD/FMN-containing dehydrogenase